MFCQHARRSPDAPIADAPPALLARARGAWPVGTAGADATPDTSLDAAPDRRAAAADWWRGAVIYQIYLRSFQDGDGDGIGDLRGLLRRLGHVADLGADAIWLSPIYRSPMRDFGYDVVDHCAIDPVYGTQDDFLAVLERAHALGLRVMVDLVLSHTSDRHAWFVDSRAERQGARADWYVWADARPDGGPPNNWLSIFGGSAWQWDTGRRQYYLHNFLASQPDLNFRCPDVQDAALDVARHWCELGVDGFRLDVVNFYTHDAWLRDNPPRGDPGVADPAVDASNPYTWQWHRHDKSQPENLAFVARLRALVDRWPGVALLGEIGDDDGLARVAEYTAGDDRLHTAYSFELMGGRHDAPFLHRVLAHRHALQGGWPCWALSNHDVPRVATRWGGAQPPAALLRLVPALQVGLRGTLCLFQGEELGLPESAIADDGILDPYGLAMQPAFRGRDGCRTPMPWEADAPDLGFGSGDAPPWLPFDPRHRALAVDRQRADPDALLHHVRRLLRWRRSEPLLRQGDFALLPEHPQVLAFLRGHGPQRLLCAYNLGAAPARWSPPPGVAIGAPVEDGMPADASAGADGSLAFPPWGVLFARVESCDSSGASLANG